MRRRPALEVEAAVGILRINAVAERVALEVRKRGVEAKGRYGLDEVRPVERADEKLYGKEGKTSRAAMELDAQSDRCNEDVDEKTKTVVSCCLKVDEALARCARLPCFPGTCNLNRDIC